MTTEASQSELLPWPSAARYKRSIRREFSLYVGGLVVVLMLVTGLIVTDRLVSTVSENVIDKILVQARSYAGAAAKPMLAADGPDALMLTDICRKLKADNHDCGWVGIAGASGLYLAHTDMQQVVRNSRLVLSRAEDHADQLLAGEHLSVSSDTIMVAVPISEQGVPLGTLALASSTRQIAAVREAALVTMSLITLIMALIGVQLTALILRRRLKPLAMITEALRKVEVGNLSLDPPVKEHNEFGFLAETLRVMGTRLEHARNLAVEADRMTRELEIAREIQANILPRQFPTGSTYQIAGLYRSARMVGGDYYDFIDLGPGKLGIIVADVSGKSLPGMLVMLLTRDLVTKHARRFSGPDQLLSAVNRDLLPEIRKGTFVTMLYAILDTHIGQIQFASAGHNPLIHIDSASGKIDLLKTKGYPLGMVSASQFDQRIEAARIRLAPGDWTVLYTDGINEAMNQQHQEYGMERFLSVLKDGTAQSAEKLTRAVIDHVTSFVGDSPQADDITLISLKWAGQPEEAAKPSTVETMHVAGR